MRDIILQLPCDTRTHFEMASFTEESLLQELIEFILPYVDSVGMNEQVRWVRIDNYILLKAE